MRRQLMEWKEEMQEQEARIATAAEKIGRLSGDLERERRRAAQNQKAAAAAEEGRMEAKRSEAELREQVERWKAESRRERQWADKHRLETAEDARKMRSRLWTEEGRRRELERQMRMNCRSSIC